jgi:hypothetical protein
MNPPRIPLTPRGWAFAGATLLAVAAAGVVIWWMATA